MPDDSITIDDLAKNARTVTALTVDETEVDTFLSNCKRFTRLRSLEIIACCLDRFPRQILQLRSLRRLNLSHNNLTSIPSIESLSMLEELYLDNNEIERIPSTIGELHKLRVLELSCNSLARIPKTVYQLRNLEFLGACGNQLRTIAKDIVGLRKLKYLLLKR